MSYVIIHSDNGQTIKGEIDEIPSQGQMFIHVRNPMQVSERNLEWIDQHMRELYIHVAHIIYLEILSDRTRNRIPRYPD